MSSRMISFGGVSLTERALFAKHLAVMLRSGLTVTESLEIAADAASGAFRAIIRDISKSVASGQSLASAFKQHPKIFSGLFVQATYAGESSGTLVENLEYVAIQLEKEKELAGKVRGALVYPAVVLVTMFVAALGISYFVLPNIVPIFEGLRGAALPAPTRALIAFSRLVEEHGALLFGGIAFAVAALAVLLRQEFMHPVTHAILLRIPAIGGLVKRANLARFCRTLGTLIKSGVTIDEALAITRNSLGNYYYTSSLATVALHVGKSVKLSEGLEQFPRLYPPIVTKMVRVGEESGRFEETLFFLADFYEAEVDTATKSVATVIEPALLILIALLVVGFALSIILPIYEIQGSIRR